MSSASRPLPYDDFLEYLTHAELQSAYEQDCKIAIRKARRRFEAEKTKSIENLRRGLNKDNQHRRVLNACLYPFAKGEVSGYHFIRAAPLAELQPPVRI